MKTMLLALAALFLLAPAVSQAGTLDTGVILELLDAGVSDVSIQRYVQRNHFTFDLSSQDLKALKRAGASDGLIGFLQDREEGAPSPDQEERTRPSETSRDDEGQGEGTVTGDYGVGTYSPYYYGFAYGYPYYYSGFYYPYYYPYYGSYYYPYYYPYPYYSGTRGGTGVVSYWYGNHSVRGVRPPAASRPAPHVSRPSSGHGGGRGGRR